MAKICITGYSEQTIEFIHMDCEKEDVRNATKKEGRRARAQTVGSPTVSRPARIPGWVPQRRRRGGVPMPTLPQGHQEPRRALAWRR